VGDWSRDDVREACLSVAAAGCPFGIAPDGDATAFADRLARPYEDAVGERGLSLRRDWGPIVSNYARPDTGDPWEWWALEVRPRPPREQQEWRDLAAELAGFGFEPGPPVPDPGGDLLRYELAATVRVAGPAGLGSGWAPGHVYDVAVRPDPLPAPARDRWSPMRGVLRRLGPRGPRAWTEWADDAEPDHAALLVALRVLHVDEPARDAEWAAFGAWLLERARRRRVWPPAEHAYRLARFAADHPAAFAGADVARTCRAALPMPPDEARADVDWRRTTPEDVRYARLTRALLRYCGASPGDA
jgi:hypothetical protein